MLIWAQRLKPVFAFDFEVFRRCGGQLLVIANIKDGPVIERIQGHLGCDGESAVPAHPGQAPPQGDLLV